VSGKRFVSYGFIESQGVSYNSLISHIRRKKAPIVKRDGKAYVAYNQLPDYIKAVIPIQEAFAQNITTTEPTRQAIAEGRKRQRVLLAILNELERAATFNPLYIDDYRGEKLEKKIREHAFYKSTDELTAKDGSFKCTLKDIHQCCH